jgi:hypothetical protein
MRSGPAVVATQRGRSLFFIVAPSHHGADVHRGGRWLRWPDSRGGPDVQTFAPLHTRLSDLLDAVSAFAGHHAPALKRFVPRGQRSKAYAMFYRALPNAGKTAIFARRFRRAADHCESNASPLYAHLLRIAAEDIETRGPCRVVVDAHRSRARVPPAASSLGFMAAVHRVVLETPGSALEPFYPSAGGAVDFARVGPAFLEVVSRHQERICELLKRPVQTNDVARCRALLGGFLLVAAQTGLPLRILELAGPPRWWLRRGTASIAPAC